jgi:hypothetical protein
MLRIFCLFVILFLANGWHQKVAGETDLNGAVAQSTVTRPATGLQRQMIDADKAKMLRQKPKPTGTNDLAVDRIEVIPPYPRVGGECQYRIWLKKYSRLNAKPVGQLLQENIHHPGFNQKQRTFWIPQEWHPNEPAFVFDCRSSHPIDPNLLQGRYKISVTLDTKNEISESIEHNNGFSTEYTLYRSDQPMADLMFEERNHYFESDSPSNQSGINQLVKIWGYVENTGDDIARPFTVVMECEINREGPAWSNTFTKQIRIGHQIKPGEVYRFETNANWTLPGLKVCRFSLDTADEVIESDEYNNAAQTVLSVRIR